MKTCIISSFDEICGIAAYTKALAAGFKEAGVDVDVIHLNQDILHSNINIERKLADEHIVSICKKISYYDNINIQFEFGLFGNKLLDINKRINKVLQACKNKNFSVTYHTVCTDSFQEILGGFFKHIFNLKLKKAKKHLSLINDAIKSLILKKITHFTLKNNGYIIVHTERDKRRIIGVYGKKTDKVLAHPLCFTDAKIKNRSEKIKEFKKKFNISDEKILIGFFGFISPYKGLETAIHCLKHLNDKYILCIFGGQHPAAIPQEPDGSLYMKKIVKLVSSLHLKDRILFYGVNESEEIFREYMEICDHVVLPYHEVGQSGSGVASLALECNPNVYLSRTLAFIELAKYFKNSFYFFDIANYAELAFKIENSELQMNSGRDAALSKYNIISNINTYKKSLSII